MRIKGEYAWDSLIKQNESRWSSTLSRFDGDRMQVIHKPKFKLSKTTSYFCIGSCFARNIEEHLLISGARVLSKRAKSPPKESGLRNNGWLNKFTTHSMLNDLEWAALPPSYDESWFEEDASGWRDLQLSPGVSPSSSVEDLIAQRHFISKDYFARIKDAEVLIMTLGLNEVWWDDASGRYLNSSPQLSTVRKFPGRYWLERTDAETNLKALHSIRDAARMMNSHIRFIVSVSPVPLGSTFSGEDILTANSFSKGALVSAAKSFMLCHDDVDYYPSFEMVTFTKRENAFAEDGIHVKDDLVSEITADFIESYTGDRPVYPEGFRELAYLAANPDVEAAVKSGHLESGYEHWVSYGRAEGRSLRLDQATDRMRNAGAV